MSHSGHDAGSHGAPAGAVSFAQAGGESVLRAEGDWTVRSAKTLDTQLHALTLPHGGALRIDLSGLHRLDTAGAWLIHRTQQLAEAAGARVTLSGVAKDWALLLDVVAAADEPAHPHPPHLNPFLAVLGRLGAAIVQIAVAGRNILGFTGLILATLARTIVQPARLRVTSLVHHMEHAGLDAVPIVGLMSFLIGAVLAFQGAEQLQRFGAEVFTVNLVAVSFLREVGILLTAILVAGRSGSAFTAQIGSMKMREEIDAMRTLGLDPVEVLVLPRILALVLTLPLLAFLSGMAGLLGGGVVSMLTLDMSPSMYVERVHEAIGIWTFWTGIIKAPFFAFLIAMIGCYEGLQVEGTAESVGAHTTQSVVEGIFIVIIVDAMFSILFVELGI